MKKILCWTPRIIMILAILFMMMFSFDCFDGNGTIWYKLGGFLISNIPVVLLALALWLAWKKELWGGILIIVASIALMFWFHSFTTNKGSLLVVAPFLLAGILFIISYYAAEKKDPVIP